VSSATNGEENGKQHAVSPNANIILEIFKLARAFSIISFARRKCDRSMVMEPIVLRHEGIT
jgi:hypothetical protein